MVLLKLKSAAILISNDDIVSKEIFVILLVNLSIVKKIWELEEWTNLGTFLAMCVDLSDNVCRSGVDYPNNITEKEQHM